MDFDIILRNGIKNRDNKNQLTEYFIREFKRAERDEFMTFNSFFDPIDKRINEYKIFMKTKYEEVRIYYSKIIEQAKHNELGFFQEYLRNHIEDNEGIDYPTYQIKRNKLELENNLKELESLSIESLFQSNYNGYNFIEIQLLEKANTDAKWLIQETYQLENSRNQSIKNKIKSLSDLITNEKSLEIVKGIKIQFKNIQGKRLKLLLMALQELSLLPKERIARKFHGCCKAEFDWDISTYPAMNDYKFNEINDKNELDSMKQYIETLTR